METTIIAAFLRTLGLVAPSIGLSGATAILNAGAILLEAGADGIEQFKRLTAEMKARHEAGTVTTAEEILADIERIKDLNEQIQGNGGTSE